MRALLLAVVLVALGVRPASGQSIWPRPYQPNQIAVEGLAPGFSDDGAAFLSGSGYLSATLSLTDNVELVGELPAARYAASTDSTSISSTTLGNPYIGLGLASSNWPLLVELGVRLPAASDNAAARAGRLSDVGRPPAFIPDTGVLSGFFNTRFGVGDQSSLRLRTGLSASAFTTLFTSGSSKERELNAHYQLQYWSEGERVIFGFSATGRTLLFGGDDYGSDSRHYGVVSVIANTPGVQPGLFVGVPVEASIRDVAPLFLGVTISTSYRE